MNVIPGIELNNLKIDAAIFQTAFNCQCNGECCHYGVYTDFKEYELIKSEKEEIASLMDSTQTKDITRWFEAPENDSDFASGVAVGTELYNGKCVFLDSEGLCVLQKLAIRRNEHKWKYKPQYCILFPLTIFEGVLTVDDEHIARLKHCNKGQEKAGSVFDWCVEELRYFFNEEDFNTLLRLNNEYKSKGTK